MIGYPNALRFCFLFLTWLTFTFCQPHTESTVLRPDSLSLVENKSIRFLPLSDSPTFGDAILQCNAPESLTRQESQVSFSYEIKNYVLSKPTLEGTCADGCANSKEGQHIHLILNNEPYLAKYATAFTEDLKPGNYVSLSFLSRSYHESIKHFEAYDLRQFSVGNGMPEQEDLSKPMLFYSRPKGTYSGADAERILLDFFVVNTELKEKGYTVEVTVDAQTFICTKWQAYLMEGLSNGEHKVILQLVDDKGQKVKGTYGRMERTFIVERTG
jgi:hypothetical protein